jgi:hypothetical protein
MTELGPAWVQTDRVREYEIGSEAWMRDRVERGLDPGEADVPDDGRLLTLEPPADWPEPYPGWAVPDAAASFHR